eukprot:CAMPEP_0202971986 /NCGR_PEP_ID=MMETSP1396-20130829/32289_1 /ASSEMBLY_ACC=CAM_ASM_000872 /TAXON_ID= /ORGANISM="Pseudokeronopsis sp., Strain Brazil" /LENGTH=278 /DNA_ID=CAMNT_0049701933 /DNA_START=41 /DNA_END=877 /DNA_ORIENTATION=+
MLQRALSTAASLGTAAVVAGVASDFFLYDVDAGQRAVIFDKVRGLQDTPVGEGTHFRIPFIQEVRMVDIRSRPRSISSVTGTKDLQMVNISLRVLSRPEESALSKILKTIGSDFDERVLPVIGNEVLKAVVAQHNAEELLSKRAKVSNEIRDALIERAAKYDLILDDVAITHLTFGREYSKAIENKQVAQQEAETQAYVVMKADQERKAAIIRAEGEAEAAELISKAMAQAGNGLIEVRRIDTAKEVAGLLSRSQNVTFLPGNGKNGDGSNILLNVGK